MKVRQINNPEARANRILLDALSFYQKGKLGTMIVPPWAQGVLATAEQEYHLVALFPPKEEKGFLSKLMDRFRSEGEPFTSYPSIGERKILPYAEWPALVEEEGSPIFYLQGLSNPMISTLVPQVSLYPMPTTARMLNVLMGNYFARLPARTAGAKVPKTDVAKAYRNKKFAEGAKDRISRKFV